MSPTVFLLLALVLQTVNASDFTKYLSEFNNFNLLLLSNVTPHCVADMAIFGASIARIATTVKSCVEQKGCNDEQKKILDDNMFAVKQLDSFGKLPAGIMEITTISSGSYIECRDLIAPYEPHYCYAGITVKNLTNKLLGQLGVSVAVCMPKSCNEEDIPLLLKTIINEETLPIKFRSASCVPTNVQPTTAFWIFMTFMAFFVSWAILASIVDYFLDAHYQSENIRKTTAIRLLLTFSFYANANSLLDTREPKEGTIRSLASIRFISMTWVAAGHSLLPYVSSDALLPVLSLWNPLLATTFTNAFLSVDTFFLLSGILVAYLFFKNRPPSKLVKNPLTWIMFYVHRFLRLTPPVMMFIGFFTVMSPFLIGPWMASKPRNGLDASGALNCQKYWWRNMLYINNFFGMKNECYPITWYLAVDTQLYVSAPLFLISLYISPIIGMLVLVLCCSGSVAYTYVITYQDDLPALIMGAFALPRVAEFFDKFYQKPWTRCPPYLIGIGVGYLLARLKGRKPKISWVLVTVAWMVATGVALLTVYGPHEYIMGADNWSKFVRATYNNFSRIGWSLAVSWVIVANHLGWGGPIATFMDHPLWQPLGRLSYCAYIVHYFIIQYVFNLDDRPTHYVSIWQSYVYRAIPIVVLSYIMAFIWSCLFEVSTTKLEKMLFEGLIPETRTHIRPIMSTTGELRIQEEKREA
uniref:NRF domain-containing protein n=1 Tax=Haemonchus contortus TaxID=6289 RepID=A0A7I4XXS6_HAECO